MKTNYFYDLPDDLQQMIWLEVDELYNKEKKQNERRVFEELFGRWVEDERLRQFYQFVLDAPLVTPEKIVLVEAISVSSGIGFPFSMCKCSD